jgi:hypothetical protein
VILSRQLHASKVRKSLPSGSLDWCAGLTALQRALSFAQIVVASNFWAWAWTGASSTSGFVGRGAAHLDGGTPRAASRFPSPCTLAARAGTQPTTTAGEVRCASRADINRDGVGGQFPSRARARALHPVVGGQFPRRLRATAPCVSRGHVRSGVPTARFSRRFDQLEPYMGLGVLFEAARTRTCDSLRSGSTLCRRTI